MLDEIEKYTSQLNKTFPEFSNWIKLNSFKSIDDFYLFLKYPACDSESERVEIYDMGVLGNNEKTLPNYCRMKESVGIIIKEGVKIFRNYKGIA